MTSRQRVRVKRMVSAMLFLCPRFFRFHGWLRHVTIGAITQATWITKNGMAITWGDIELRLEWINKRDVFAVSSLLVLCFLTATVINDFVQLLFYENTHSTTQNYSMALLVSVGIVHNLIKIGGVCHTKGEVVASSSSLIKCWCHQMVPRILLVQQVHICPL